MGDLATSNNILKILIDIRLLGKSKCPHLFCYFSLQLSSPPFYFIYLYIKTDIYLQIDTMYIMRSQIPCLYCLTTFPCIQLMIEYEWVKTWFSWDFQNSSPVLSSWDLEKRRMASLWCICQVGENCWQPWYGLTVAGDLQKERWSCYADKREGRERKTRKEREDAEYLVLQVLNRFMLCLWFCYYMNNSNMLSYLNLKIQIPFF